MRLLAALAGTVVLAGPSPASAATLTVGRDGNSVQATIDAAAEGDVVVVPAGRYEEHVRIEHRITLRGRGRAVIDGGGEATVVTVVAAGAVIEGLTIRGSGTDLGASHSCIYTEPSATGVVVRDNRLADCAFGIWIHESDRAIVTGNRVEGRRDVRVADRGNGIHLFDASFLEVRDNVVTGARDGIYVSATDDSLIADNRTVEVRYGIHYMYSQRNTVSGNHALDNTGGIALMQSRELDVLGNVARRNQRFGLLFRDAQYCTIRDNVLEHNGQGMFFFSSTENVIEGNRVAHNETGAKIWAGSVRNAVARNAFVGNRQQIFFVGAEDLEWGLEGPGNFWSDYAGWDQGGDDVGDRPHRVDSFTANLLYTQPAAVLLLRSPAIELLTHLEARMPVLRVPTVVDHAPLMRVPR
jgi:nitrous oxidase accessory protein